jgi:hypothetical protein
LEEIWRDGLGLSVSLLGGASQYFKFVDKKLDISKDCHFNTCHGCGVRQGERSVDIATEDGLVTRAKYYWLCCEALCAPFRA